MISNLVKNAIGIYIIVFFGVYIIKPKSLFEDRYKKPRQFGIGYSRDNEKKTLFSISTANLVLAITSFILAKHKGEIWH